MTSDALTAAPPQGRRLDKRRFEWNTSLLLLPAGILIAAVFVYAVGYSFYIGLTNLSLLGPTAVVYHFTGAANLDRLVHDTFFLPSLWVTFLFVFGSGVVGATVIGLALALLMQKALAPIRLAAAAGGVIAFILPPGRGDDPLHAPAGHDRRGLVRRVGAARHLRPAVRQPELGPVVQCALAV